MIKVEIPVTAIVAALCFWVGGMPLLLVCIGVRIAWGAWNSVAQKRDSAAHVSAPSTFESPQLESAPLWNAGIRYDRDGTAINSLTPMREPRARGDLLRLWVTGVAVSAVLLAIGWILHLGGG